MSIEIILGQEPSERGRIRINPENPEFELRRQSRMWANRVAKRLGFSTNEAYMKTLPKKFGPKPESFKDLYIPAVPILVDPRVELPDLLDIVGIPSFFDLQMLKDWLVEGGSKIPKEPYTTWLTYIPNKSVIDTRVDSLKYEDRQGGIPFDGIALYLRDPYILNEHSLDFPGSQVGFDYAPFLSASPNPEISQRPNHPFLHYGSIDSKSPKFASVIRSKIE